MTARGVVALGATRIHLSSQDSSRGSSTAPGRVERARVPTATGSAGRRRPYPQMIRNASTGLPVRASAAAGYVALPAAELLAAALASSSGFARGSDRAPPAGTSAFG